MPNFIVSHYAKFGWYHGEVCSFLEWNGGEVGHWGGEEWSYGREDGGEAAVAMYCMKE